MGTRAWPEDWDDRKRGADCPMCAGGRVEENRFGVRFFEGRFSDAYLQRVGFQPGYTVAVWRERHVAEPTELSAEEATGYWLEVIEAARAIESHYRPVKLNFQMLGNVVPHLHTHIVPRYLDDPAPGAPLPFPQSEGPDLPAKEFNAQLEALRKITGYSGA